MSVKDRMAKMKGILNPAPQTQVGDAQAAEAVSPKQPPVKQGSLTAPGGMLAFRNCKALRLLLRL
jgi:hypothetical protein